LWLRSRSVRNLSRSRLPLRLQMELFCSKQHGLQVCKSHAEFDTSSVAAAVGQLGRALPSNIACPVALVISNPTAVSSFGMAGSSQCSWYSIIRHLCACVNSTAMLSVQACAGYL
jgi:hypothetical protein